MAFGHWKPWKPTTARAVGQRLGISGTPAIFAPDGTQLGGYLPADKMREALDKLAGDAQAGKPAGMP